jgi:hypothetical protein
MQRPRVHRLCLPLISFILSCKLARPPPDNRWEWESGTSALSGSAFNVHLFLVTVARVPRWHSIANQVYGTQRTGARSSTLPWLGFLNYMAYTALALHHRGSVEVLCTPDVPGFRYMRVCGPENHEIPSSSQAHGCGCVLRADRECFTSCPMGYLPVLRF